MKVINGKDLFDSFNSMGRSLDQLKHIAEGLVPCKSCGGIGWVKPSSEAPRKKKEKGARVCK